MKNKNKSPYVAIIMILMICVTIGYALLNTTLNITGKSNISKNTWDVRFDYVSVGKGSVEAIKEPTIVDGTSLDFEVSLDLPGDYYMFTVDVVNNGTIDAMIESIVKEPELTDEQKKYLNYSIEYDNGIDIASKQLVAKESYVALRVMVEYRTDILESDLPTNTETLNLGFTINYVQADESGILVPNNGENLVAVSGNMIDEVGDEVCIKNECFYVINFDRNYVTLLSKYNLYVGGTYDWNNGVWNVYGAEATGLQEPTMKGQGIGDAAFTRKGTTPFSSSTQKGTNYSDYNGSIVETYVNNYKNLLENKFYLNIKNARLVYVEELVNDNVGCTSSDCSLAPEFIYRSTYWTGTALDSENIYSVTSVGTFSTNKYDSNFTGGVRPVIVLHRNDILELK